MAGFGSVSSPNEVTVTKDDGSAEKVKTKNILVATGSEPIPFPGLEVSLYDEYIIFNFTLSLSLNHHLNNSISLTLP